MQFEVTAISVDVTKQPCSFGEIRTERVDTGNPDTPYAGCTTIQDIEFAYERHWNYREDPDVLRNPEAKRKVLSVYPVFAA